MPIVYLTLMNANIAVALFLLAVFIYRGIYATNNKYFIPAFTITGFVSLVTGLHMTFTWPMPGAWNIAFGEPSIMIGALLLGAAWSIHKSWSFTPLGVYGAMAGLVVLVIAYRIIDLGLGENPVPTGLALIFAGLPGIFALPATFFANRNPGLGRLAQWVGIVLLVIAAGMLAYTSLNGYLDHLESFSR